MKHLRTAAFAGLAAYVSFFALLAVDVLHRLWVSRAGFAGEGDLQLLLLLETVRAVVTMSMVGISVVVVRRREPGYTALAFALLFFALLYVKASSYAAFPGYLQERIAGFLNDAGVPQRLMLLVFGQPIWALAPAVAAFLMFSLRYPTHPEPDTVRSVHATGRRGMLRDVALAGADVRSLVHHMAARVLDSGAMRESHVIVLGLFGAILVAGADAAGALLTLPFLVLAFAFACTFLRTAHLTSRGPHNRALRMLGTAGISLGIEFLVGGALSFLPGGGLAKVALALAAAAPLGALVFLFGFALALRDTSRIAVRPA